MSSHIFQGVQWDSIAQLIAAREHVKDNLEEISDLSVSAKVIRLVQCEELSDIIVWRASLQ